MGFAIFFSPGQGGKCRYYPLCLSYHAAYKFYYGISLWPNPPPLNIAYCFSEKDMYKFLSATNFKASSCRNENPSEQKKKINVILQSKKY